MDILISKTLVRPFLTVAIVLSLAAALVTVRVAAGSQVDIDTLMTEIETLKQGQEAMKKDLVEIKKMLQNIPARAQPQPFQPLDINISGAPFQGAKDAPVTLVEFTDFQCPYCGRYFNSTLPDVIKLYVDTGKVRYVVREMPLTFIHPYAQKAAEAALCADAQGKFWEMHDALFRNQANLKLGNLTSRAGEVGLDLQQFSQCLESGIKAEQTQQDVKAGMQAGVRGTPTFFFGRFNPQAPDMLHATQIIRGAQSIAVFKRTIDALLTPVKPPKKISSAAGS